jgi:hypothetical protein
MLDRRLTESTGWSERACERRRACRYRSALREVSLSWAQQGRGIERAVSLEDLSVLGCRVKCRCGPVHQPGLTLWLHVPPPGILDPIEAELVSSRRTWFGPCTLRIRFREPLSYAVFHLLVHGTRMSSDRPDARADHERDHYWR